jgi:hypothetical protein
MTRPRSRNQEENMDGKGIGDAIASAFIVAVVIAFCFGVLVMLGLPRLWEVFRPWLHAITA